ncbi:autotransporter outer membrane beta-barrel domain-containing protein [Pseudomonas coleopterorum]|uniref:autotransporter outer membrane beta-barrel domain-containing protein n=1 Tax=Pseudomonas coleopterorum TaxID=1605838 RepID=UPI000895E9CD|nr:autotransporter outer membrane beta-barrel domain-containing protein [Pseudomonas coleopterorum]SEE75382.1 outer membrane autotransporter barrel domain-containing protein [Pseudomonas coleopterorum]
MPYSPHRLALAIALLTLGTQMSAAFAKDLQIDTATQATQSLSDTDRLIVGKAGSITASTEAIKLKGAAAGTGVVVDNSGRLISTGNRAIDSSGSGAVRSYTLINRAGGLVQGSSDAFRIKDDFDRGAIVVDNSGTLRSLNKRAIDLEALKSTGIATTLDNRAGGLIRSEKNDAMKTGINATITNHGEISTGDTLSLDDKYDGIDVAAATGVSVYNYGLISGGRHGVTTDEGALLYNEGTVIGRNGSGYGSDGNGTVINRGLISGDVSGLQAVGDGDGVDIDYIGHIENYGTIRGTGASGAKPGDPLNASEGIAMGGGYIFNASGATISGADNAILIDDGSNGSAHGATYLENHGSITGLKGFGVQLNGEFADTVINAGTIGGSNGQALQMGAGDDSLTVHSAGRFIGLVDGGSGSDRVNLQGNADGSFGNSRNFETLEVQSGTWTLTSVDDFSAQSRIANGATLINQGSIAGALTVDQGGVYAGGGAVGNLLVNGTLATNSRLGTAVVRGDLTLARGATLAYGVNADGSSAPLRIAGAANLDGATLNIVPSSGEYPWQSRYTVLQAGSVNGRFATVTSDYAFLTPTLSYSATSIDLDYARNDIAFADYASTVNGGNAARSMSAMSGGALYEALLGTRAASAGMAIEQLAGSSNASLGVATLASTAQVGQSMLSAMRQMGSDGGLLVGLHERDTPVLAANGVPDQARNLNDPNARGRVWIQALGSYGKLEGAHGGDGLEQRTSGAVLGTDWALTPEWRAGLLGGYSRTDLDASGVDGNVDSWHAGLYAMRQSGPLALRLGAAYSKHDGNSKRTVSFDGFSDRPQGDYDADSQQAFAELGYNLGSGRLSAEPFANLGYQRYSRNGYREKGGPAALDVESQTQDNFTSTFGVRLAHLSQLDNGMSLTPRGSLGWRHTYGDVANSTRQAFLSGGSGFNVEGSALDRDSLMLEAGLDLGVSARQSVGISYSGELGSNNRNHALAGHWQLRF